MADDILDEADEFIQDGGYAGPLVRKMRDEIERLRLTDAERKTLEWAILLLQNSSGARVGVAMDNTLAAQQLRKLLERCATGSE